MSSSTTAINGIDEIRIVQLGMIVRDAAQSAAHYRQILGLDHIPTDGNLTEPQEQSQAVYYGSPMDGRARIIAFDIGSIQFEFIEPVGDGTVWNDYLNQHGEGLHHVALFSRDSAASAAVFAEKGYQVIQQGYFGNGSGQYTYLDTDKDLGIVFELLHHGGNPVKSGPSHPADKGLGTDVITQVGIIVHDIAKTSARYAEVLGLPQPQIHQTPGYATSKTTHYGEPSEATAKLAFMNFGQVTIELIEPDEKPSVWRNYLNQHGEGAQHIAFQVRDTQRATDYLAQHQIPVIQQGLYADGSGMYTYVDSNAPMGICVELLHSF